jgi:hypothetical protein
MTYEEIYDFLYDWIEFVVDPGQTGTPPVIRSHTNTPAPGEHYVTIQYNGNRRKVGRPSKTDPDELGIRKQINDYEVRVQLWESKAGGDLLNAIINSVELIDVHSLFTTNNVAYMGEDTDIQDISRKKDEKWETETTCTIRLMIPISVDEESSYISDVQYTGIIPAQGRNGDHSVTNT